MNKETTFPNLPASCPPWCQRHDEGDEDGYMSHAGPKMLTQAGVVGLQQVDDPDGYRERVVYLDDESLTPEAARQVARTLNAFADLAEAK